MSLSPKTPLVKTQFEKMVFVVSLTMRKAVNTAINVLRGVRTAETFRPVIQPVKLTLTHCLKLLYNPGVDQPAKLLRHRELQSTN